MANKITKEFIVSTADWTFLHKGVVVCTGTTNLNTSINVSMQEQAINAGKGSGNVFRYKYGRELTVDLEAADWRLEYIAMNTGSQIFDGLRDVFAMAECVTLTNGKGSVAKTPIGKVAVELPSREFVSVEPEGKEIDLTAFNLGEGNVKVKVTYQYKTSARSLTIDATTAPLSGELILDADQFDQTDGKIGSLQIDIPSFSVDGNFDLSFTPDGVTSTSMAGKAQAVESDSCEDGNAVYAYVTEIRDEIVERPIISITASAETTELTSPETTTIEVIGQKSALGAPIAIDNAECTFSTTDESYITVGANTGEVSVVATGKGTVTVKYGKLTDTIEFNVIKGE